MCINSIGSTLSLVASTAWHLVNSSIFIAFVGGFSGAIGGALGAQRIAERSRKRQERLKELRYTNSAIMIAHTICNAAIATKKQHVKPMRDEFLRKKEQLNEIKAKIAKTGSYSKDAIHMQMDLRTFPSPVVPIDTLKHVVFRELSSVGRPLALVAMIEQTLIGLANTIARRDQIIQSFSSNEIPPNRQINYYFGLPFQEGHINQEYPDLVDGIYSYVDDLAFFSHQLCIDLIKHGTKVRKELTEGKSTKQVPRVSEADFSSPLKSGLIPPDSEYRDWTSAYVEMKE